MDGKEVVNYAKSPSIVNVCFVNGNVWIFFVFVKLTINIRAVMVKPFENKIILYEKMH